MTGLLLAVTLASCGSQPLSPNETEIKDIRLVPESIESQSGRLAKFAVEAVDGQGRTIPNVDIEWTTADPTIAIVDPDGTVWSFKEGSVEVTAHPGKGHGTATAPGQVKKNANVTVQATSDPLPSRVDDLRVESIQNSAVNLTFTEVDDGTGAPADYLVRFQIAPLEWGTAANVTFGSCAGRLAGTTIGATRSCSVSNLVEGTTYEFQLIALRGSSSDPTYGDLSNVVSATMSSATTAFEGLITQHTFAEPLEDGWLFRNGSTDPATEPNFEHGVLSGDGYGQANYPTSLKPGTGPIFVRKTWTQADEVTVNFKWQLSPNFDAATGSMNKKIFFLEASNTHPIVLGSQPSRLYLATQRTAEPGDGAKQLTGGSIVPGRVYDITLYVKVNSVDSSGNSIADGVGTVWVDGVRVIHGTDFRFRGNDSPVTSGEIWEPQDAIDGIRWNPTWPGGGDSPSEVMWERIYDIAVWSGSGS